MANTRDFNVNGRQASRAGGVSAAVARMYDVTLPVRVMPIGEDNGPALDDCLDGLMLEIGATGMLLELHSPGPLAFTRALVGVEDPLGEYSFAVVESLAVSETAHAGTFRFQAQFVHGREDLLCLDNLTPQFDPHDGRYKTKFLPPVLASWVALGVLEPVLVDHVLCCPTCAAVTTVRRGCCGCGSVNVSACRMIHHFACAYVAAAAEFEQGEVLVCPKCRDRDIVVGADFEIFDGSLECQDCGWIDADLGLIGACLACDVRFPLEMAQQQELLRYDVQRLDPLAVIDAA